MKKLLLAALAGAVLMLGQGKQPQIKSKKEAEAWQAILQAQTPEARITAVDSFLTSFADTELKVYALQIAMESAQQTNDTEKTIIYAERTLEVDPKSYAAMLAVARNVAQRTREFDLDKEEKLSRVDKNAKEAIELLKTATKPNEQVTDEQWEGFKKDLTAQGYEALGMAAMIRKKNDEAATHFQASIDSASTPEPATYVRLAAALNGASKWDESLAVLDKLLAMPDLNPAIRQFAGQEKLKAATGKAQKK